MSNKKMPGMPSLVSSELEPLTGSDVSNSEASEQLQAPDHLESKPILESAEDKIDSSVKAVKIFKSGIEVVALRKGFYNQHRIVEGEKFIVKSFQELGEWMKCLDPDLEKKHMEEIKLKKAKK